MFVGIDVSKDTLDVVLLLEGKQGKLRHKVFANTATGHSQLLLWLHANDVEVAQACLEATGTYAQSIAVALHQAGHNVSLVNPALIRAFGQSQLKRTKTDKAGRPLGRAQLIARFCQMHQPPMWSPPAPEVRELQ